MILLLSKQNNWFLLRSAHIIPGLLLFCIGFVGNNPAACIALISAALGFNGATSVTSLQNVYDLAPNYASSIAALKNVFAASSGFIAPMVIAFFTKEKVYFLFILHNLIINSLYEWVKGETA